MALHTANEAQKFWVLKIRVFHQTTTKYKYSESTWGDLKNGVIIHLKKMFFFLFFSYFLFFVFILNFLHTKIILLTILCHFIRSRKADS